MPKKVRRTTLAEDFADPQVQAQILEKVRRKVADMLTPGEPMPAGDFDDTLHGVQARTQLRRMAKLLNEGGSEQRAEGERLLNTLATEIVQSQKARATATIKTRRAAKARRAIGDKKRKLVLEALNSGKPAPAGERHVRRLKHPGGKPRTAPCRTHPWMCPPRRR